MLVPAPTGAQIPLSRLARFDIHQGPPSIKTEGSRKTAWLYVDLDTSDIGGYVARAKEVGGRSL